MFRWEQPALPQWACGQYCRPLPCCWTAHRGLSADGSCPVVLAANTTGGISDISVEGFAHISFSLLIVSVAVHDAVIVTTFKRSFVVLCFFFNLFFIYLHIFFLLSFALFSLFLSPII